MESLIQATQEKEPEMDYLALFLQSREAIGASPKTLRFYRQRLSQFAVNVNYRKNTRQLIERYLKSIPANENDLATRHVSFRVIKIFYRWLEAEYGFKNPLDGMLAPILGKPILPGLTQEQVFELIRQASTVRYKAIIVLFTESVLRLSELTNICPKDIYWQGIRKEQKRSLYPVW